MGRTNKKNSNSTYYIVFISICFALCIIALIIASSTSGLDSFISILSLIFAGFVVFILTYEIGIKWALLVYVVSAGVAFFLFQGKAEPLFFAVCYGPFGIIHGWLSNYDNIRKPLKLVFSVVIMVALMSIAGTLVMSIYQVNIHMPYWGSIDRDEFTKYLIILGVIAGIICYIFYYPFAESILRQLHSGKSKKQQPNSGKIIKEIKLPKLYKGKDKDDKEKK